jgi:hypothetical protein
VFLARSHETTPENNPFAELAEGELHAEIARLQANLSAAIGNNAVNNIDPDGLIVANIAAALLGGAADFGLQMLMNGGRLECVSWASVGISALSTGIGYGAVATAAKLGKLGRAARVLEKAAEKRLPLTKYMKGQVAAAKATKKAAAGGAAGLAAAQAAKAAAKAMSKESLNNPESQEGPNGSPPCP